ncbi:MAG TPA: hypothetical protein VNU96_23595 [Burkholderiales bacterium]|jgi:hypothetical protein|nr:hypothetical protein [Burkholderiales bacterium]
MRLASFILLFSLSLAAHAQQQRDELGVRYWYSGGTSTRSHNAQGANPSLGNPTSVLTYEDLEAHALELHGRKRLTNGGFIKGNLGLGNIKGGSFDDEDFNAGQVKKQDTTSTVKGNYVRYATIDFGGDVWRFRNGSAGLFVGYQYWRERLDAYGVVFTVPPIGRTDGDSVPVVTNDVTWQSLRVGITGTAQFDTRTRFLFDGAFVPYAKVSDEDSHWMRVNPPDPDFFLGPAPNIHIKGTGYGFQFEAELRHEVRRDWEVGAGLRYWWLRATDGTRTALGFSVPLSELTSQRGGFTLSVTHRW